MYEKLMINFLPPLGT